MTIDGRPARGLPPNLVLDLAGELGPEAHAKVLELIRPWLWARALRRNLGGRAIAGSLRIAPHH